jgi:DNA polymerase II large subunit
MAKPEGSKMREMKPPIHTLFVVGHKVGTKRLVADAAKNDYAVQVGLRYCEKCGEFTTKGVCSKDGENTIFQSHEWISPTNDYKELYHEVSAKVLWDDALTMIKEAEEKMGIEEVFGQENLKKRISINPIVKGVKGMTSKDKINEHLVKGILREKNDISTFRDGTMRFDMVDITMTHFKPIEIGYYGETSKRFGLYL